MTLITVNFKSNVLHKSTSLCAIIPEVIENLNQTNFPVLYLLHGMGDDYTKWFRRTNIEQFARNKKIIIISADFETSFYSNMAYGNNYWDFLTQELPQICNKLFPISPSPQDHYVAGMSMGGFGAFKWGLNEPNRFHMVASFSGVMTLNKFFKGNDTKLLKKLNLVGNSNYLTNVYQQDFGNSNLKNSPNDLEYLLSQQTSLPQLFQYCGTEDPLFTINKEFSDYATSIKGTNYSFITAPGSHEWNYWNKCIKDFLNKIPV